MDISFKTEEGAFKYRVVGVLKDKKGRILIQKVEGNSFYCLPGGRVELGESSGEAIARELKEELGFKVDIIRPLFSLENFFKRPNGSLVHENSVYFEATSEEFPEEDWELVENDKGVLKKLTYKWVTVEEFKKEDVRPDFLKEKLTNLSDNFEQIVIRE